MYFKHLIDFWGTVGVKFRPTAYDIDRGRMHGGRERFIYSGLVFASKIRGALITDTASFR